MTTGTHRSLGIELNGIADAAAVCHKDPIPDLERPPIPKPACVLAPALPGERPVGGDLAYDSLDGRGWDPQHQRARYPVLPLLLQLDSTADLSQQFDGRAAGDLLAAHIRAIGNQGDGKQTITVPDTLSELGQQRILDGLRKSNISVELLWRPVATLLGWSCRLSPSQFQAMDCKTVLVLHAGFWGPEASLLHLELETHQDQPVLMPIRRGKGIRLSQPNGWPIEQIALNCIRDDLNNNGSSILSPADLVWVSRRPWSALCNTVIPGEVIRDANGCWHRLNGTVGGSQAALSEILRALKALLAPALQATKDIDLVIIEGSLVSLSSDNRSLGDLLAKAIVQQKGNINPQAIQVFGADACLNARGAAHYGWRRRCGIPGYYDSVPDLKINACIEDPQGPDFISLMKGKERVVGGQAIGPLEVPGFSIAAHADAVNYYLTRADELTVRETRTVLPQPPPQITPVKLVVTQTPGQGFASVEIRPPRGKELSYSPVFLDWSSMRDTGRTPEEILSELSKECGLAYPEVTSFPCHAAVWETSGIVKEMRHFLALASTKKVGASDEPRRLMSAFGRKASIDFLLHHRPGNANKAGIVDSDGTIPAEQELRNRLGPPPTGFKSYQHLFDTIRAATGSWFQELLKSKDKGSSLHRHLLLIGGWCYSSVPPQILAYTKTALKDGNSCFSKYDFNVAGRCFSQKSDIKLLFDKVDKDFKSSSQARNSPFDRVKALSLVLSYRPDAPLALSGGQARRLAEFAAELMRVEQEQNNIQQKFFKAAHLLMGLLRYRRQDAMFLDPGNAADKKLVDSVKKTLEQAQKSVSGNAAYQIKVILEQMTEFIEKRGTNALIFSELDRLSEKS